MRWPSPPHATPLFVLGLPTPRNPDVVGFSSSGPTGGADSWGWGEDLHLAVGVDDAPVVNVLAVIVAEGKSDKMFLSLVWERHGRDLGLG